MFYPCWLFLLSAMLILLTGCEGGDAVKPTNLILVSIDTLRADHLGCYGYAKPTSPAIDAFSAKGVLFNNVSATSPWTLPSHSSLLTGLYPRHNNIIANPNNPVPSLPPNSITLAAILKKQGLQTAAFVNSTLINKNRGFDQGFCDFKYFQEDESQIFPSYVIDEGIKWLSKHGEKPFFLFLHSYDVHSDYRSLPRYEKQFVSTYNGKIDGSTKQLIDFGKGRININSKDLKHLISLYDAGVRQFDDEMSKLFNFLEQKRLLDSTLVIITSDHGEEFLEHGNVLHGKSHFQESIHIPLVIRGPGIPVKRINTIASLVDIMPTILSQFGFPTLSTLDGIDLSRQWKNSPDESIKRSIYIESEHDWQNSKYNTTFAIRDQRYKLFFNVITGKVELFDLLHDQGEKTNIASMHKHRVSSMLEDLKNFIKSQKSGPQASELSEKEIEKLQSLGYLQ